MSIATKLPGILLVGGLAGLLVPSTAGAKGAKGAKPSAQHMRKTGQKARREASASATGKVAATKSGAKKTHDPREETGEGIVGKAALEAAPLSLRGTRGAPHPDCSNGVPLWKHIVQPADQLGLIAGRYGVRARQLVELNPQLSNPNHIVPGQEIRVCPEIAPRIRERVVYSVRRGDNLTSIATAHGLTVRELVDEQKQPQKNLNRLRVNTKLEFWVDKGIPEAFLPPLPKPPTAKRKRKKKSSGRSKSRPRRVAVHLDASDHVHIKRKHLAFGTIRTIALLNKVVAKYKRSYRKGPKVVVGDISRHGGGRLGRHLSHRGGRDVDVGYVLKGKDAGRTHFSGVTQQNLDVARTWALVKAFLDTREVVYIFMDYRLQETLYEYAKDHGTPRRELDELFQYPRGRGRSHGLIRHWRSHKHHFHVRFQKQ